MPATFHFYLREDRPDKRGVCPVYLRITHNRKLRYINTGIRLEPKHWNPDRQEVRKNHRNPDKLNQELEIIRENAGQAYRELNREKRASAEAIKKRLEYASKDNFFSLADEYLNTIESESFWTHKQTKVAIEKLRSFHGSNHLPVNLIDADYLIRFQAHLKKFNQASTIIKNLGCIKNILDIAVRQHLIPANPIKSKDFQIVKNGGSSSKTKLTLEQIQAIENMELPEKTNIWHSRNAFILSFYFCGMRFGDVAELRWNNVKNGRLEYDMNKTGNPISLPIKERAKKILDAYKDADNNGYVFPFLTGLSESEQKSSGAVRQCISSWNALVNKYLKDIAEKAGTEEAISMHVARHSFAQYAVNDKEIPPYKIMMLLGHKNIKTTMQYLKSLDLKTVDTVMDEIF